MLIRKVLIKRIISKLWRLARFGIAKGGADCIVTPCTQCHTALDTYQQRALKGTGNNDLEIPILHLSQLIGLAIGISKEELGFERHMVNPLKILENIGF